MDGERFDRLVESLTRSGTRRGVLRTLIGAILGAAGLRALAGSEAAGKDNGKKTRRGNGRRRNRNGKRVRAQVVPASCCSSGNCTPGPGKNLSKCCYEDANLAGKIFKGANLGNANLSGATLTNADFRSANLGKTCFVDANLTGAMFGGANTGTAIFCRTTMPDGSINNSGCNKATRCCQTCVEIEGTRCAIGGECCGGAECTGSGDGVCACPTGETDCDGTCVDLQADETNCGICGTVCPEGESCQGGNCRCGSGDTCAQDLTCCSGQCVDLTTDVNNCFACGDVCPASFANAIVGCGEGFDDNDVSQGFGCIFTCNTGFGDCNDDPDDGCETGFHNNNNNCGGCGVVCGGGTVCRGCTCKPENEFPTQCQGVSRAKLIRR